MKFEDLLASISLFKDKLNRSNIVTLQSPLSKDEDNYLAGVCLKNNAKILKFKASLNGRNSRTANLTTTFYYMLDMFMQYLANTDDGSNSSGKNAKDVKTSAEANVPNMWIEFKNQDLFRDGEKRQETNNLAILIKRDSPHLGNIYKLEKLINDNEFDFRVRHVSEFMRFIIYSYKQNC